MLRVVMTEIEIVNKMTWKWGNILRLSRQAQCNHKCPLKRKKETEVMFIKHILKKTKLVTAGFHNTEAPKAMNTLHFL